jgi:hypothetical protein
MRTTESLLLLAILLGCGVSASAQNAPARAKTAQPETSCSPLAPINPAKGFSGNFNNPCYAMPMVTSSGSTHGGDANATYSQLFYQLTPGFDLVVIGTFPNARFMSATLYDAHTTAIGVILDYQMPPMGVTMTNPFLPGAEYHPDQMYAFTVSFGGTLTSTPLPGCGTTGSNINETVLDATQIHSGLSWNGYPGLPGDFPVHQSGANTGGLIMIRKYIGISSEASPVVIVRQLSTGCAVPLTQATNIISNTQGVGTSTWINQTQTTYHHTFSNSVLPTECYPFDPENQATFVAAPAWVGRDDTAAAYTSAVLSSSQIQSFLAGQTFMRIQFPLPSVPPTPCPSGECSRTGNEELRYFGVEFDAGSTTLTALDDQELVTDPNGNVTLIVGVGQTPPSVVTPGNYYTYLNLAQFNSYSGLTAVLIRNILPNATFECSTFNVPNTTMEYNPPGGFMGAYVPTVDFPTANQIPALPDPPVRPNSCYAIPPAPVACSVPRTPV